MCYQTFGNAHTADFFTTASLRTIKNMIIKKSHLLTESEDGGLCVHQDNLTFKLKPNSQLIEIYVDFIELLRKPHIDSSDAELIKSLVFNSLFLLFPYSPEPKLKRVDLRFDVRMPKNQRDLYWLLLEKTSLSRRTLLKKKWKPGSNVSLYYMADSDFESARVNIYDKEYERENKEKPIHIHDRDIVRFEVQLFNRHLNYRKAKYGIEKELCYYLSDLCRNHYIESYIIPILFSGTYRSLKNSYQIIQSTSHKKATKDSLKQLLKYCDKGGIDYAKKKYALNSWNKNIKLLSSLDINPIPIPKSQQVDSFINPLSLASSDSTR